MPGELAQTMSQLAQAAIKALARISALSGVIAIRQFTAAAMAAADKLIEAHPDKASVLTELRSLLSDAMLSCTGGALSKIASAVRADRVIRRLSHTHRQTDRHNSLSLPHCLTASLSLSLTVSHTACLCFSLTASLSVSHTHCLSHCLSLFLSHCVSCRLLRN
jgi:translation initiation factor 2B subunit (eIF-2B alpha/beta/delta family)